MLVWHAIRLAVAARRAELARLGLALAASARQEVAGGVRVWVGCGWWVGWLAPGAELEAAADDEAVRAVGPAPVISALARVALQAPGAYTTGGTVEFGEAEHFRYRVARLEEARPVRAAPTALVGSSVAVVASAIAWSACVLAGAEATIVGVAASGSAIAAAGFRPTWAIPLTRR